MYTAIVSDHPFYRILTVCFVDLTESQLPSPFVWTKLPMQVRMAIDVIMMKEGKKSEGYKCSVVGADLLGVLGIIPNKLPGDSGFDDILAESRLTLGPDGDGKDLVLQVLKLLSRSSLLHDVFDPSGSLPSDYAHRPMKFDLDRKIMHSWDLNAPGHYRPRNVFSTDWLKLFSDLSAPDEGKSRDTMTSKDQGMGPRDFSNQHLAYPFGIPKDLEDKIAKGTRELHAWMDSMDDTPAEPSFQDRLNEFAHMDGIEDMDKVFPGMPRPKLRRPEDHSFSSLFSHTMGKGGPSLPRRDIFIETMRKELDEATARIAAGMVEKFGIRAEAPGGKTDSGLGKAIEAEKKRRGLFLVLSAEDKVWLRQTIEAADAQLLREIRQLMKTQFASFVRGYESEIESLLREMREDQAETLRAVLDSPSNRLAAQINALLSWTPGMFYRNIMVPAGHRFAQRIGLPKVAAALKRSKPANK